MLDVLVNRLRSADVEFCSWKNNHEIDRFVAGESDLDLLVRADQKNRFLKVLTDLGYKEAAHTRIVYPHVRHFYCLGVEHGKLYHLHVYFKLVTGESHVKNYRLPFENAILEQCLEGPHGCPVPVGAWQLAIFVIRHYIKISCLPGLLLFLREGESYRREYESIQYDNPDVKRIGSTLLGEKYFEHLLRNMNLRGSYLRQYFLGMGLRYKIRHYRRIHWASVIIERYAQIIYRSINKLWFRRKKHMISGGALIAITGLDGAGKSSLIVEIERWLKKDFDIKSVHVGRPDSSVFTLPINLLLGLRRLLRRRSSRVKADSDEAGGRGSNFIEALRYYSLAIDRLNAVLRASRAVNKGYIVLCDRYPSISLGKMDSPRIFVDDKSSSLVKQLAARERQIYSKMMGYPDLIVQLHVPVEVALCRNRERDKADKESDEEIISRYEVNRDLDYVHNKVVSLDTNKEYQDSVRQLKKIVWEVL